ncbi:MAG: condensation domain-containing protein, partial [Blastocatellia bacterium]
MNDRTQEFTDRRFYELSFAQQRIWLLGRMEASDSFVYNIPLALTLSGPLDVEALERSIGEVLRRQEVLRATFHVNPASGTPVQVIHPWTPFHLERHDLTYELKNESETERHDRIRQIVRQHNQTPLDLETGPAFQAVLL